MTINARTEPAGRPMTISISRPRQPRYQAHYRMGERIAGFDRTFSFYQDLVEDADVAAKQDPQIFERMMRDAHYLACLQIRQLAVASLPITMVPPTQDKDAQTVAQDITEMLTGRRGMKRFTQFLLQILNSIPQGLSINEIIYGMDEKFRIFPKMAFPNHKDKFVFDLDGNLCVRSPNDIYFGERVPDRCFIRHTYNPMPGSLYNPEDEARVYFGMGTNQTIYPWFIWKQLTLNMDFRFLDRFGNPTLIGRFPRKNKMARDTVMDLMNYLTNNGKMVWPSDDGYDIDVHEANGTGHQNFMALLEYIDKQISQAVLGSTLLLDQGDVGSYALGKVHQQTTFGRIAEFDRRSLEDTLNNTLVKWIMELNHWDMKLCPTLSFTVKENEDIFQVIEALKTLQEMGFEVSSEMITEKTGFRKARPGETILTYDPFSAMGGSSGLTQENGEGSPLAGTDLIGTGKDSFNAKALKHHEKFQEIPTTRNGRLEHSHIGRIDRFGNGQTSMDMGHRHEIRNWRIMLENGHDHQFYVLKPYGYRLRELEADLAGKA